jgi:chloramphenicol 3-O phosphotransferase
MSSGQIILLNGASSSGKSSVARELQALLPEPYLHPGIDHFLALLPGRYFGEHPPADEGFLLVRTEAGTHIQTGPVGHRLLAGMYASFAALAAAGNHLIIDHVLLDREGLAALVAALPPFQVLFVGIRCPLEVLAQRERARSDRAVGMARAQFDLVHAHALYDLEIDTSTCGPREAAGRIKQRLEEGPPPSAFARLARQLDATEASAR